MKIEIIIGLATLAALAVLYAGCRVIARRAQREWEQAIYGERLKEWGR